MLQGAGGFAALSMSGTTLAEAREAGALDATPTDPHTRDVFRAIVDAIVPRTPQLADELGDHHEPGALDAEIERFLIWDFDHFQEVRAEALTSASRSRFEAAFSVDDLDLRTGLLGTTDRLFEQQTLDGVDLRPPLGALERFEVTVARVPETGPVDLDVVVETTNETVHRTMQNYPYAEALATAFELVAVEFVATGRNRERPAPVAEAFPAGGPFVRLAPRDRLRCLDAIIHGSIVDRLDDRLGEFLPALGVLKFAVMGVFGLTALGYYSEWPAYGATRTATPNERTLAAHPGDAVGRRQTGYPGPAPGYPAHRGFEVQRFRENDWGEGS